MLSQKWKLQQVETEVSASPLHVKTHRALMSHSYISISSKSNQNPNPPKVTNLTLSKAHNSHIWGRKKKSFTCLNLDNKIKAPYYSPYFQNILGFIPLICPFLGQFLNLKGKTHMYDCSIRKLLRFSSRKFPNS